LKINLLPRSLYSGNKKSKEDFSSMIAKWDLLLLSYREQL